MGHKPVPLQGGESNYPPFIDQRTTVKQKKSIGMDNYHFRKTFIKMLNNNNKNLTKKA